MYRTLKGAADEDKEDEDDEYLQLDDVGENFAAEFSGEKKSKSDFTKKMNVGPAKTSKAFRTAKLVGHNDDKTVEVQHGMACD